MILCSSPFLLLLLFVVLVLIWVVVRSRSIRFGLFTNCTFIWVIIPLLILQWQSSSLEAHWQSWSNIRFDKKIPECHQIFPDSFYGPFEVCSMTGLSWVATVLHQLLASCLGRWHPELWAISCADCVTASASELASSGAIHKHNHNRVESKSSKD